MTKKKIDYGDGKTLIFDEDTSRGVIIDHEANLKEIEFLKAQIAELEAVLKNQKKLSTWAEGIYPEQSGLNNLRKILAEKEALL